MGSIKKPLTGILVLTAMLAGEGVAQGIAIPQVPANAAPADGKDESAIKTGNDADTGDYQNQIMTDPKLNDRARAEAVINQDNSGDGNATVINQEGESNASPVTKGNGNSADQQVEQYNHKVKTRIDEKSEETTIEQAAPPAGSTQQ